MRGRNNAPPTRFIPIVRLLLLFINLFTIANNDNNNNNNDGITVIIITIM